LFFVGVITTCSLTCVFNFSKVTQVNVGRRQTLVNAYVAFVQKETQKEVIDIIKEKRKQDQSKHFLHQTNSFFKNNNNGETNYDLLLKKLVERQKSYISSFVSEIKSRFFLVYTFKFVTRFFSFYIIALFVILILSLPFLILYFVQNSNKFQYSILSTEYYNSIINTEYLETNNYALLTLKDRFGYSPAFFMNHLKWKDPPYNTIPNTEYGIKKLIDKNSFNDFLNSKLG